MLDDLRVTNEKKGRLETEDDDEQVETFDDYELRVKAFVAASLASASSSKRDDYKDGQVYQERKTVIHDFLKAAITKKCQNPSCGA
jgi:ribosomal protein S3AE